MNLYQHPCTSDFLRDIVKESNHGSHQALWQTGELTTLFVDYKVYEAIDLYHWVLRSVVAWDEVHEGFLMFAGLAVFKGLGGEKSVKALEDIRKNSKYEAYNKQIDEVLKEIRGE